MSRGASRSQEQNKIFSSVRLIGGIDCTLTGASRYPDLDVDGGARIRKSLCVNQDVIIGGDASIEGNLAVLGDVMLDTFIVTNLMADFIDSNSAIIDNLVGDTITANSFIGDLFGNICSDTTLKGDVTIEGNLSVQGNSTIVDTDTVVVEDSKILLNNGEVGSGITAGTAGIEIDRGLLDNYLVCFDEAKPGFVVGTVGNTQCVALIEDTPTDGGLTYYNATTNQLESDPSLVYDPSSGNLVVNLVCADIKTNSIVVPTGPLVIDGDTNINGILNVTEKITAGNLCVTGNLDIDGVFSVNVVCADIKTDSITPATPGGTISLDANVDMQCLNVSNIQALFVDQVFGKNSPVNFEDNANFRDGHKITFVEGIMMGNLSTTCLDSNSIAIGKGAGATGNNTIAVGHNAGSITGTGIYNIFVGANTNHVTTGSYNTCVGTSSGEDIGTGSNNLCLGSFTDVFTNAYQSVSIGYSSSSATRAIAIGFQADASSVSHGIAIGSNTDADSKAIAIGYNSSAGFFSTAMGSQAQAGSQSIAIGTTAGNFTGLQSICIGHNAKTEVFFPGVNRCIVIGADAYAFATSDYGISIGSATSIVNPDQIALGRDSVSANVSANATCWEQIFQNRSWSEGNINMAVINATGDITKDATGNVCLTGSLVLGGSLFVSNIVGTSPVTIDNELFVQGNVYIDGGQVLGPSQSLVTSLSLDGGLGGISPDGSLVTVGNTLTSDVSSTINDNIADLAEKVNMILDVLVAHGLMA